jgi:hypothetical protein
LLFPDFAAPPRSNVPQGGDIGFGIPIWVSEGAWLSGGANYETIKTA